MSPENDQTRWIGIRPTNPPETIPVSMAAPPPCAKVEPCAANNAFNVITKKLTPAISDLQAIESVINFYQTGVAGAAGFWIDSANVPADRIWIVHRVLCFTDGGTARSQWQEIRTLAVVNMMINFGATIALNTPLISTHGIVLDEGQKMSFYFGATGGVGTYHTSFSGYQVSKY